MKKLLLFPFLFVFTIFFTKNLLASHVPGGNITYEYIAPNTWAITLTVIEDCGNAFMNNAAETIIATNTCGLISPNISLPNIVFQNEVSQICPALLGQSSCSGGFLPGVFMHVWSDTIILPGSCDSWVFSYDDCCRDQSVNLVGISNDYYFETILNSTTGPTNSSPVISSDPIPYNCVNQPVNYNFGVIEPDGDSLHFSLVDALENATTSAPYAAGYTGPSPINGIAINPNTGEITFTPTIQGNFVVVVLIEEFNSNGDLVGSVMQDFQFEIIACNNIGPSLPTGGIVNFYGDAILTGPFDIEACEGDSIYFDMEFTDNDLFDSLFISSNITQLFPGATVVQNGFFSPVTASFCMVVLPGTNPFTTISVTVNDNACPTVGTTSSAIGLTVISSTYAGPDVTMCQGIPTLLNSSGGSNFNWSVISGDPISLGSNFSCNGCPNPVVNPAYSTVYEVVSNLSVGCSNTDTISVNVAPDFNYSINQSATTTCLNAPVQFNTSPSASGSYSYQWSPATFLTNSNTATPEFNTSVPGLYEYEVTIVSNLGCVKVDTLSVNVLPAYSPDITLTASDTNVFCGDTVYLDAGLGGGVPAFCGPSGATSCNAPSSFQTVGINMASNGGSQYPSPFGNYYKSVKEQYLFRAAELIAAGFSGGKITEIAWDAIAQNGATDSLNSYTIKMGCTNQNTLSSWQSGLSTVFSPQNITVVLGANDFPFTTAYEWDGISNLIVEVCYDNTSITGYTQNWSVPHQIFPYNTTLNEISDVTNMCPSLATPQILNKRPVTKFKTCPIILDLNNFSFQWTPPSFLSSTSDQSPYSIPFVSTYYNVVVTDLNGGCTDTASIFINVLCDTCDKPVPTINGITCYGGSDGSITGIPSGVNGPPWILQLMDGFSNVTFGIDSNVTDSVVFDNLSAGNYVLSSLDTNGCYADTLVSILDPAPFVVTLTNITSCDSISWNGNGYNQSGIYPDTLQSIYGCDSIVTLDLTINQSANATDVISSCDSITWIDGITYTATNNTATYTLTNSAGCDSIVTLNLTINQSANATDVISSCDSITWIDGITYTATNNTATYTLTNSAGCDSIVTLDLTINQSANATDVISSCDSITWIDGITYTATNNTATYTLTNSAGCDSIVTLNLTITTGATTTTQTSCDSLLWNGTTYNSSGTYTHNLTNGCVDTLVLTIFEFLIDFTESATLFTSPPFVVQFTNTTPNLSNYNFTWDFGDSALVQNNNATLFHEYFYNGLYSVKLMAQDITNGCGFDTLIKEDLVYCAGGPGVSIIEVSNQINIFPNPTNQNITISIENFSGNIQTEVYDLIGHRLQSTSETTISLRDYARGIYLLKVAYGDRVEEVKVIKE